jgi:tetratricopeptide (TPR) repeat protein
MINALFDLLGAFYQSGDLAQAEWIARSILQAIPDDSVSLQFLGLVYYRTRRRAQALQVFAAAAGNLPREQPTAATDASLQASAQCLPAASGHGSTLAGAWYDLGLLLFRLRRPQQAVSALRAALNARPDFHRAQRALALISHFSGRIVRRESLFKIVAKPPAELPEPLEEATPAQSPRVAAHRSGEPRAAGRESRYLVRKTRARSTG